MGICRADRILPVVPMFHANAWGLPYAACMAGASLIMPEPLPAGRAARAADRARAGDGGGRGADDLARRAALVRRAQARPLEHPDRGVRRRGRPARAHEGVRGAPRHADHPGLGHDRDEPARVGRAPAGGRRGRGALGLPLDRGPPAAARAGAARGRRRHGGRVGRRDDRRAAGARAVDRADLLRGPGRGARSSTTAGCARATSPRSTRAATSASPTARRTSSSPAASGSPPSTSRTS